MSWAQWDSQRGLLLSVVNTLPESIRNLSTQELADLGYHELVITWPEDKIHRFATLVGSAKFELRADGKVEQSFPDADFSVAAVRGYLREEIDRSLRQTLYTTDWMFIRQLETGKEVPADVKTLRERQRAHGEWLIEQVNTISERELVDFQWMWPTSLDQTMLNGVPVIHTTTLPPPRNDQNIPEHAVRPADVEPVNPLDRAVPTVPVISIHGDVMHPDALGPTPTYGVVESNITGMGPYLPTVEYTPHIPEVIPPPPAFAAPKPPPPTTDGPVDHYHDPSIPEVPSAEDNPREMRS